jgi:single-strand DNA-binding protein
MCIGNLGRDPETRTFANGDQICTASIGLSDKWKDKQSGEMREHTEWVRLVFNGRLAEIAAQYLRKGSQIYVEGQIRTRKYTDKDGAEKYATDIRVDQMQMLGSKSGDAAPASRQAAAPAPKPSSGGGFDDLDSDIPF